MSSAGFGIVGSVTHLSNVVIESYALRELSDAQIKRLEKHVAACPDRLDRLMGELGWAAAMRSPLMAKVRIMAGRAGEW
jgi:hypothetical protein